MQLFFISAKLRRGLLASLLSLGTATLTHAQGGAPPTTGPTPPGNATTVPLDGGASLLLAAGVGLGLRRLRRRKGAGK